MGRVIRDNQGNWITGYYTNQHLGNHIKAKLLALIQGLQIAKSDQLVHLEINVDYKKLIDISKNNHPLYSNMIFDYRVLLNQLGNPPVLHSYRETNRVTDALAKEGAKISGDKIDLWHDSSSGMCIKFLGIRQRRNSFG